MTTADQTRRAVLDIMVERTNQNAKWGEQNHPDLSARIQPAIRQEFMRLAGYRKTIIKQVASYYGILSADRARESCDHEHKHGQGSWFSIHVEELGEALEAAVLGDTVALRTELVQLAATVTAHIEAIDRRSS